MAGQSRRGQTSKQQKKTFFWKAVGCQRDVGQIFSLSAGVQHHRLGFASGSWYPGQGNPAAYVCAHVYVIFAFWAFIFFDVVFFCPFFFDLETWGRRGSPTPRKPPTENPGSGSKGCKYVDGCTWKKKRSRASAQRQP